MNIALLICALGLAAGQATNYKKLTLYEYRDKVYEPNVVNSYNVLKLITPQTVVHEPMPIVPQTYTIPTQITQGRILGTDLPTYNYEDWIKLRTVPYSHSQVVSGTPIVVPTPYTRNEVVSGLPITVHDIYLKPVIVMVRVHPGADELNVYYLEHGLSTLDEKTHTLPIHDYLKVPDMHAVLLDPSKVYDKPVYRSLKDYKIHKFDVVPGLKLANLVHGFNYNTPIVYLYDKDDSLILNADVGLTKLGDYKVTDKSVVCTDCF